MNLMFPKSSLLALAVATWALLAASGCGPQDTIKAFDVELVTSSECSQVGVGAVQCEDPDELARHTILGRWIIDERDNEAFILTTHRGRSLPGLFFPNTSEVTTQCNGSGGTCYFARSRTDVFDTDINCVEISQRAFDSVFVPETGVLSGVFSDITVTDENCGTPFVQELLINVTGTLVDEAVLARELYQ